MGGGHDAQGNGDEELQHHSHQSDPEGNPHIVADDLGDGLRMLERSAQIPFQSIAQPAEITREDPQKGIVRKPVYLLETVNLLLRYQALFELRGEFPVDIIGGQTAHEEINQQGHDEENQNGVKYSLDDVFYHIVSV